MRSGGGPNQIKFISISNVDNHREQAHSRRNRLSCLAGQFCSENLLNSLEKAIVTDGTLNSVSLLFVKKIIDYWNINLGLSLDLRWSWINAKISNDHKPQSISHIVREFTKSKIKIDSRAKFVVVFVWLIFVVISSLFNHSISSKITHDIE